VTRRHAEPDGLALALSPYHLSTREAPAMAALVLADRVVTLLPVPEAGVSRAAVRAAVDRSPRYLRLLESWRWSGVLWRAGVVSSEFGGVRACDELERVFEAIVGEPANAPLRPLVRTRDRRTGAGADEYLDALSHDVIRGGPDPGLNIPVTAALDRFAAERGVCVVRGATASLAQRAEGRLGRRVFSVGLPMLLRGDGEAVASVREACARSLADLRAALVAVLRPALERSSDWGGEAARDPAPELSAAARAFTQDFGEWASLFAGHDDAHAQRIVVGYVNVSGVVLPEDAVLRSGRMALQRAGSKPAPAESGPGAGVGRLAALVVREMNVRPE
jgi:hypothetical protein